MKTPIKQQTYQSITLVVGIVLLSTLSFNCSKSEGSEPANDMNLVGIWDISEMVTDAGGVIDTFDQNKLDVMGIVWKYDFKNDLTLNQTTNIDGPVITLDGTWSTETNNLTTVLISHSGDTSFIVYYYGISGNILNLKWEIQFGTKYSGEWTKQ